jgi:hypothetical protein
LERLEPADQCRHQLIENGDALIRDAMPRVEKRE